MTQAVHDPVVAAPGRRHPHLGRQLVGGFYLVMGGVHLGLVSADTGVYRTFADEALFGFVRDGWADIVMPHMAVWGLLLMAGEITLGTLLLVGGRAAPWGWAGVIAFHLLLLLFGFWAWAWAVPALVVLVLLARHDLRVAAEEAAGTDDNRKHDVEEVAA
jgi:hypothetical protein